MYSAVAVTSDATTAVKSGFRNQRVVLCNRGSNNITVKTAANTRLNGSVDIVITPNGSVTLRWGGTFWFELGRSIP